MNIIKNVADLAAMYDTTPEHLDDTVLYTVTLIDRMCDGFEPWVATFSTREQAHDFMDRVGDTLREHGVADHWLVSFDSQMLNSTEYIDWLHDYLEYNEE